MSLDVYLEKPIVTNVYSANITHNLGAMAEAAGIYKHLWRPEEIEITHAWQLIEPLSKALKDLKDNPEKYKVHNSANGWGVYDNFVPFVENYLKACIENHDAKISVWR